MKRAYPSRRANDSIGSVAYTVAVHVMERTEVQDPLVHKATSIQSGAHLAKICQVWLRSKGQGSCSPQPFRAASQQQQPGPTSFSYHHPPHGSSSTTSC